jgi:hypothetical protein
LRKGDDERIERTGEKKREKEEREEREERGERVEEGGKPKNQKLKFLKMKGERISQLANKLSRVLHIFSDFNTRSSY